MERGVNYILIGLSFIITLIGLIIFIFWFGGSNEFGNDVKKYKAYSKSAVDGIKVDSAVKYRGISVGKVTEINFRDDNFDEIVFDIVIREDLPIKKGSILKVGQSGLLGSAYLSIIENENTSELLSPNDELKVANASVSKMLDSVQDITGRIDNILANTENILSDENAKNITSILASVKDTADKLNKIMDSVHQESDDIGSLINNIREVSHNANTVLKTLNKKVDSGEYDIKTILTPTLMSIEQSMNNINELARNGSLLLEDFKQNPYDTIFGYREEK